MSVFIQPHTLAYQCYQAGSADESYYCNFGLNPEHLSTLTDAGLVVSGVDQDGEVRIVELPGHRFFMGTLFVPQTRPGHTLMAGFYRASTLR